MAELTARFALLPDRGNENIKYFISVTGDQTQSLSYYSSTLVLLRRDWPQIQRIYIIILYSIISSETIAYKREASQPCTATDAVLSRRAAYLTDTSN